MIARFKTHILNIDACLKFHEGEHNLVSHCILPQRFLLQLLPCEPHMRHDSVFTQSPISQVSFCRYFHCPYSPPSNGPWWVLKHRLKLSLLPSALFTPSSRPPPSAHKHPDMTAHHTSGAWWVGEKKNGIGRHDTHTLAHTRVWRHTDTEENEHNLPVGYILLLMDRYWFYGL